jgi:hypothetical protein
MTTMQRDRSAREAAAFRGLRAPESALADSGA